jgi:hypothetical protein
MKRHRASLCCDLDTVWTTLVLLSTYFRVSPGGIGCGEGDADAVRISRPSVCFARSLVACVLSLSSTHAPRAPRPAQQPCVIGLESQRDGLQSPARQCCPCWSVCSVLASSRTSCPEGCGVGPQQAQRWWSRARQTSINHCGMKARGERTAGGGSGAAGAIDSK